MKKNNLLFLFSFIFLILIIFGHWFFQSQIIGGDWPYFFPEALKSFSSLHVWRPYYGNGFGGINEAYFLQPYFSFTVFISGILGISWDITYKIFWFGLFLAISILSSNYLAKIIFTNQKWLQYISSLIFCTNTYILMIVGGGQLGYGIGYAMAPLILGMYLILNNKIITNLKVSPIKRSLIFGLFLGIQLSFDPRVTYLSLLTILIFFFMDLIVKIFNKLSNLKSYDYILDIKRFLFIFIVPSLFSILLNAFWILPIIYFRLNPVVSLGKAYSSISAVKYFSFATLPQSLSMLHPNWPENIFGKVGFMKPEFLLLPILAYLSLLFLSKRKEDKQQNTYILFFALLGLIGAFLAKGANAPFGGIYLWAFQYIPGFISFRDPTKWYILISISYSILIPYSILFFYKLLNLKYNIFNPIKSDFDDNRKKTFLFFIFIITWSILIQQALVGQLSGTFSPKKVPVEYVRLKNILYNDKSFSRTLWIPRGQRFGYISDIHPAVDASSLFQATNSSQLIAKMRSSQTQELLADDAIKYVIIPYDSLGEIFTKDRKYDPGERKSIEDQIDKLTYLKKIYKGKLTVYQALRHKKHFWLDDSSGKLSYKSKNPSSYSLIVDAKKPTNINFVENYSSYWKVEDGNRVISAHRGKYNLNIIPIGAGYHNITIYFAQEKIYDYSRFISLFTICFLSILLIMLRFSKLTKRLFHLTKYD